MGRKEGSWPNPFLFLFGDFRDFFFLLSFALLWRVINGSKEHRIVKLPCLVTHLPANGSR